MLFTSWRLTHLLPNSNEKHGLSTTVLRPCSARKTLFKLKFRVFRGDFRAVSLAPLGDNLRVSWGGHGRSSPHILDRLSLILDAHLEVELSWLEVLQSSFEGISEERGSLLVFFPLFSSNVLSNHEGVTLLRCPRLLNLV